MAKYIVGALACLFVGLFPVVAHAQGIFVSPVVLDLTARPGEQLTASVHVRSTTTVAGAVDATMAGLSQGPDGNWVVIDPAHPKSGHLPARSCYSWIRATPSSLALQPLETGNIDLAITVPPAALGFYSATLAVQTRKPPGPQKGITVVLRCLVLVFINVRGRPARERFGLTGANLEFHKASPKTPASTTVSVGVSNTGETFGHMSVGVSVLRQAGASWRRIATTTLGPKSSLPETAFSLTGDLTRRLPSGRYRLDAALTVDDRPAGTLSKVVDFVGDPSVTQIASDVNLQLDPPVLVVKAVPGSTRVLLVKVQNPSPDAVQVACAAAQPSSLQNVMMGQLTGNDFTCAPWLEVWPARFTLRGGATQAVQITARVPQNAKLLPRTYANLTLHASYPDGESAGTARTLVTIENPEVPPAPNATAGALHLAHQEKDRYSVTAEFDNVGTVDYGGKVTAVVANPIGNAALQQELQTKPGPILPLMRPLFSGVLDFAKVKPGAYLLTVTLQYAGKRVQSTLPIGVASKGGRKIVTVLDRESRKGGTAKRAKRRR